MLSKDLHRSLLATVVPKPIPSDCGEVIKVDDRFWVLSGPRATTALMSAALGKADSLCSARVIPGLTQLSDIHREPVDFLIATFGMRSVHHTGSIVVSMSLFRPSVRYGKRSTTARMFLIGPP